MSRAPGLGRKITPGPAGQASREPDRFTVVLDPALAPRVRADSISVILDTGSFVIKMSDCAMRLRDLTQAMNAGSEYFPEWYEDGGEDDGPAVAQRIQKLVMEDARIAVHVHPGNQLHIAPGAISVNLA